ncbi:hypothetical protein [Streptococcus suis]|uniref:hypothetical protein n=1 Tax=Streptococcus suis TaxID=1307 RepID=UPI001ABE7A35|nr:hypothetical protein [Streptococcus suis]
MKKVIGILILVCGLFLIYQLIQPTTGSTEQSQLDQGWYAEVVSEFHKTEVEELVALLASGEEFVLFAGRASCPHCHQFLMTYSESPSSLRPKIYYLDTENREDKAIQDFRQQLTIETVPYMAYFSDGQEIDRLEKGSKTSLEEMETFFRMVGVAIGEK